MDNFNHDKDEELIDLGAVSEETKGGGFTPSEQANPLIPQF